MNVKVFLFFVFLMGDFYRRKVVSTNESWVWASWISLSPTSASKRVKVQVRPLFVGLPHLVSFISCTVMYIMVQSAVGLATAA